MHLRYSMKKINFHFLAILGILIISYSCEYSPSEIPDSKLEKPSDIIPGININLTPEMDTLKLTSSTNVNYTVYAGERNIYRIEFYLDEILLQNIGYTSQNSAYTAIPAYEMSDGLHELKIRTYTSTNSGSIADKVQAEQYLYELKWPVLINKEAKNKCKILKMESTFDGVNIMWDKYDYADFPGYKLTKYSNIMSKNTILLDTSNPLLNFVIDKSYVEGDYCQYSLSLTGVAFDFQYYHEDIKRPKIKINPDLTIDVTWSPSKYQQSVKSYFLKTSIPQFGYPEDHEISDLSQTAVRFNEKIGFAENYEMQLRYIPKGYEGYNIFDVAGGLTQFAIGDSIPAYERGFLNEGTNSLLIYKDGKFSKYNCETGQSPDALSVTPIESVDQRFIIGSTSGNLFGYFEDQQFVVRNSDDLLLVKRLNLEAYEGFNFTLRNISLSDNGVIATIDYYNTLRIFNNQNGMKIIEKNYDSSIYLQNAVLTPDGRGVCIELGNYSEETNSWILYNIELNQLNEISRYVKPGSDSESTLTFSPVNGKIVYFNYLGMYNYKIDILNPQTLVVENTVQMPQWFIPIAYDYSNDRVIGQFQFFPIERFSYLLDVKTGKQSKIVQFVGREQLIFSNGTVYSGNGRSINVDDYIIQ